jgi:hypothetical protein
MMRSSRTETPVWRVTLLFLAISPFTLRSLLASGVEPVFAEWPILILAFVSITLTSFTFLLASGLKPGGLRSRFWVEELVDRGRNDLASPAYDVWAKISERLSALGFQIRTTSRPHCVAVFKGRGSAGSGFLRHGFVGFVSVQPDEKGVAVEVELRLVDLLLFVIQEERRLVALVDYLSLRTSDLEGVIGYPAFLMPGIGLAFATASLGLVAQTAPIRLAPWISASSWAALGLLGWTALGLARRRLARPGVRFVASGLYLAFLPHLARVLRAYIGA